VTLYHSAMANFSAVTIKQLFGLSMNVCAFPACENHLIDMEWPGVMGEICHICAASPGGPRYDPNMTDQERDSFHNLILMCPTHHVLIDRLERDIYTADVLRDMKAKMIEQAMSGSKKMLEKFGDDFVERAVAEIILVSERYYSLPSLPPMATSSPAYLEGRADSTSSVIGNLTVGEAQSMISDKADASGSGDEVTSVGGPGASLEHEVVRRAHDEIVVDDSAGTPYEGRHATDESLNEDHVQRD
jgi:hypothetical protein